MQTILLKEAGYQICLKYLNMIFWALNYYLVKKKLKDFILKIQTFSFIFIQGSSPKGGKYSIKMTTNTQPSLIYQFFWKVEN